MWTGWGLHHEFDLIVCLLVRSYSVSFKILHIIPHSTTMEPYAVCGFPSLSIGALDCRDRNITHGFRQFGCHISIYRLKNWCYKSIHAFKLVKSVQLNVTLHERVWTGRVLSTIVTSSQVLPKNTTPTWSWRHRFYSGKMLLQIRRTLHVIIVTT